MSQPKIGHKVGLWVLSLTFVIFLAGVIYTYYSDSSSTQPKAKKGSTTTYLPLPTPPPENPNTPVGISINALTPSVPAGSSESYSVQTSNFATCNTSVAYSKSDVEKLPSVVANDYGVAQWNWLVPKLTSPGTAQLTTNCSLNHKGGLFIDSFQVTVPDS